ncbi:MAG: hypothetical protein MUE60_13125 [Candidatus Eisenbacteria bacterium]|jgi:hypothetical protein|nr:hypothetical protein [Candidatus Eisenbacteria bacterium]
MCSKRNIVVMASVALILMLLNSAWTVFGAADIGSPWPPDLGPRLDGAWVVVAQGPNGPLVHNSFLVAQDAQGLRYTQIVEHTQCSPTIWGMLPEANSHSQMMGLVEKTGPTTMKATIVHYGLKVGGIEDQLVYICVTSWEGGAVDEDHLSFKNTQSFYQPEQDADHDGLPDPGQKPFLCVPFEGIATRVKLAPMCVPAPMPAPSK